MNNVLRLKILGDMLRMRHYEGKVKGLDIQVQEAVATGACFCGSRPVKEYEYKVQSFKMPAILERKHE